jgi:excisionase family DNA binding protein
VSAEAVPAEHLEPISARISVAVKLTGIGRLTIYEQINEGHIEIVKIGRSTLTLYRSLKRLIEGKPNRAA